MEYDNIDIDRKLQFSRNVLNLMKNSLLFNIERNTTYASYATKPKSEFMSKISYALNTVFKIFLTSKDMGHWFDFKSYKEYRERRGILSSSERSEIASYNSSVVNSLNGINKRMLASVENTLNLIEKDENALCIFYERILDNEVKNIYLLFKDAMTDCGANIEILKTDYFGKRDLDVKDASPLLNDSLLQIKNLMYRENNFVKSAVTQGNVRKI